MIVGYAIGRSIDARLTVAALKAAVARREPPPGCIHHSDRGSQGRLKWSSQHGWRYPATGPAPVLRRGQGIRPEGISSCFLPVSFGSAAIIFPSRPAACSGRRAERRSGTAGRLSARPGSALPGRSLTGASTAAGWCAPGSRALARTPLARGSRVRNGGDADYRSLRLTREDGPAFAKPDYVTAASRPAPLRAFSSRASFSAWR